MKSINDLIGDALDGKDIVADPAAETSTTNEPATPSSTESATSDTPPAEQVPATPDAETPPADAPADDPLADMEDIWGADTPAETEEPTLTPDEIALKAAMESDEPPKEGKAWGALKSKLKEYEKQIENMQSEPSKLMEQLEAERKKYEEIELKFEQVSLIDSPKFKQEYNMPIQQSMAQAARLLSQHAGKEPAEAQKMIDQAVRMPFADRNRFLMDTAPELQGVLSTILLNADEKIQIRAEAIKSWEATRESLKETELRSSQVQSSQTINDALTTAVPALVAEGNPFYRKSQGSSPDVLSRNQAVDLRVNAVKQVLLKNDTAEIARYVADGFVGRETREALIKYRDEAKKLRAELKEVAAQKPGVKEGVPAVAGTPGQLQGATVSDLVQSAFAQG